MRITVDVTYEQALSLLMIKDVINQVVPHGIRTAVETIQNAVYFALLADLVKEDA